MTKLAPGNVTLTRGLSLVAAVSIVVGNVIGSGVFIKTRVMTCNVGTPMMVLTVWLVAGLLSLAGALTYAELAAMMPRAGGEYVFVREAYGSALGFLYGWMQFFIGKTGSQASSAVIFATFLNILTQKSLDTTLLTTHLFGHEFSLGSLQIVALGILAVVTLINCATVKVSGNVAAVLTAIKIALILVVGVGAFVLASGDWGHFLIGSGAATCEDVAASARFGIAGFGAAMLGALWAYDGWNNLTLVAGEIKNPQRNIPLALIGGMIIVGALYLLVNVAYFYVLTPAEVAGVSLSSSVATEVARKFLGPLAVSLVAAALVSSSFGTLHTSVLTGARVPYAMARDRLFFQRLARVSPRTHVPIAAVVVQGLWAGILALSGSFDALTDYVIFAEWIFYGLVTASIIMFRRRMPDAERPYRAWGYPVVPVLFLLVTGFLLVNTLYATPRRALIGLGLMLLGLPVYYYWAHRNRVAFLE